MVERIRKTHSKTDIKVSSISKSPGLGNLLARLQSKVKRLRNEKDKKFSINFIKTLIWT